MAQEQTLSDLRETEVVTGRRDVARLRLYLPGRIKTLGGEYPCFVEDISQTGARIIMMDAYRIGHSGILRCGELDVFFDRLWTAESRAGLAFDELIAPETLYELRRIHDNFDNIQREEIRRMAHDWVNGLVA